MLTHSLPDELTYIFWKMICASLGHAIPCTPFGKKKSGIHLKNLFFLWWVSLFFKGTVRDLHALDLYLTLLFNPFDFSVYMPIFVQIFSCFLLYEQLFTFTFPRLERVLANVNFPGIVIPRDERTGFYTGWKSEADNSMLKRLRPNNHNCL